MSGMMIPAAITGKWFSKAHELDLERFTQLGNLGYLPPEYEETCRIA